MLAICLMVAVIGFEGSRTDAVMGQHIVGQDQRMAAFVMAKVKVDAVPLQLAAQEIQIGFTILHGIFKDRIVLRQGDFQRRIAKLAIVAQRSAPTIS